MTNMQSMVTLHFRVTGFLLISYAIYFNIPWTLLQITFDYPGIVRKSPGYILTLFHERGTSLIAIWYAFAFAGVLFLVVAIMLYKVMASGDDLYIGVATIVAVFAAITQAIGLVRWVSVAPYLSEVYVDPSTDLPTREAVVDVFETYYTLGGIASSEQLWQLFIALWTAFVGLAMRKSPIFKLWLAKLGILIGIYILLGSQFKALSTLTPFNFGVWSIWLIATGVFLLKA